MSDGIRFDGWGRPSPARAGVPTAQRYALDPGPRDVRMQRAVEQVLKQYHIRPETCAEPGQRRFRVSAGPQHDYQVTLFESWDHPPRCTCPDATRLADRQQSDAWCKHVLAVLLKTHEFRGQLLDLFL